MSDQTTSAAEEARRRFDEQIDRLRPVIRERSLHLQMIALMGTAKHLRSGHGIEDPPTDAHALALLHMELHAAETAEQP